MGLSQNQIQVHVDFDLREVTFLIRGKFDIKPKGFKVPFAIVKGVLSQILKAEAEDELTALSGIGDQMVPAAPEPAGPVLVKE